MSSTEEIEKKETGNLTVGNDEDVVRLLHKMEARTQILEEQMGVVQETLSGEIEKEDIGNLTVGNDEDVLRLLQKMEARMQSLEEQMGVVQKALFHPVNESEPARLPLENDVSKSSASDIRTEEIRSEEVPESQDYHLPWQCYGCNARGRLTECKNCHHFFCRKCQYWCSDKLWGCGHKLCNTCNEDVPDVEYISKGNKYWWCRACHTYWSNWDDQ